MNAKTITYSIDCEINREKAIEMIVGEETIETSCMGAFSYELDTETDIDELAIKFREELQRRQEHLKQNAKRIEEKKEQLNELPTHEIYEEGEKQGLWIIDERQLRLDKYV